MVRTGLFQRLLIAAVAVACGTSAAPAGIVDAGGEPDPTFAGLRLWLSGGSDVFNDAGVTPATDGQTVQQWNNLATAAGAASNSSQGNAAYRPTFEDGLGDLLGGNPVVRFDGSSTYLDGTVTMGTDKTFFMVWKDTGTTGTCCSGGIGTRTGGSSDFNGLMSVRSGSEVRTFADFSGAGFAGNTNILGTPVIGTALYQASGTSLYLNGASDGSNTADWGRAPTQYQVGTRNNEAGRYLRGDVAEILVYEGALSADDQKI